MATSTSTPRCSSLGLPVERHAADHGGPRTARAPWRTGGAPRRPASASSRVGTRTSPRGRRGRARSPASRLSRASPNASVLPEPVWPRPSRSRPARASGRVAAWMGNGAVKPSVASARSQRFGQTECAERGHPGRGYGPQHLGRGGRGGGAGRTGVARGPLGVRRSRSGLGAAGSAASVRRACTAAGLRGCHSIPPGRARHAEKTRTSPDASKARPRGGACGMAGRSIYSVVERPAGPRSVAV